MQFGRSITLANGEPHGLGVVDDDDRFSIQSASKAFTLSMSRPRPSVWQPADSRNQLTWEPARSRLVRPNSGSVPKSNPDLRFQQISRNAIGTATKRNRRLSRRSRRRTEDGHSWVGRQKSRSTVGSAFSLPVSHKKQDQSQAGSLRDDFCRARQECPSSVSCGFNFVAIPGRPMTADEKRIRRKRTRG